MRASRIEGCRVLQFAAVGASRAAGVPTDVFDDVESIARSMTAALPISGIYNQLVGPFYNPPALPSGGA
ncbi:hypothetical protein [Rhodococcus sp. BP22]|uniref:hypothetical protein n=1 Tax=Rhodococcus sp. BP22 TaxID=2758566 RepID=UPI0021BD0F13|nr:hypothetical protein [Rhodococcus sp. BP22]